MSSVFASAVIFIALAQLCHLVPLEHRKLTVKERNILTLAGYMPPRSNIPGAQPASAAVLDTEGILRFQKTWRLEETGQVNAEVLALLDKDRCGNSDDGLIKAALGSEGSEEGGSRKKRYAVLPGGGWTKDDLTYRITEGKYTSDLSRTQVDSTFEQAFKYWTDQADLRATKTSSTPDIEIYFASGYHGDGDSFDGRGGVLAHAFSPRLSPRYGTLNGDTHFDDGETWRLNQGGADLLQVATHELGHSLGLDHSGDANSVMYPWYSYTSSFRLGSDDIAGIRALYGAPQTGSGGEDDENDGDEGNDEEEDDDNNGDEDSNGGDNDGDNDGNEGDNDGGNDDGDDDPGSVDFCANATVDAALVSTSGDVFFFRGNYFARITDDYKIADGYPKLISQLVSDVTSVDAALTLPTVYGTYRCGWRRRYRCYYVQQQGAYYVFEGSRFYRLANGASVESGNIADKFEGAPSDIDAAFTQRNNQGSKIFLVKGDSLYRLTRGATTHTLDSGYPVSWAATYPDIPNPSAVMTVNYGYNFFFEGNDYYKTSDTGTQVVSMNPPYPRPIGFWWFGCPSLSGLRNTIDGQGHEDLKVEKSKMAAIYLDEDGRVLSLDELEFLRDANSGSTSLMTSKKTKIIVIFTTIAFVLLNKV